MSLFVEPNVLTATDAQAESAIYKPLDTSRSEVRLLQIQKTKPDQPVKCRLRTVSLDDNPIYVALSYVWGDPSITRDIVVDGHVKPVTINLEAALRHVKDHWESLEPDQEFLLWADAVCINQDDIPERNTQVQIMGSIYRKSSMAFVWLGQHDHDTKTAFECARWVHKHIPGSSLFTATLTQFKSTTPLSRFEFAPFSFVEFQHSWTYIAQLTRLPWFERAWTFQEAVLPLEVLVLRGIYSLPLECIQSCMAHVVNYTDTVMSSAAASIFETRLIKNTLAGYPGQIPPYGLERVLVLRRHTKASDPRDVLFSLLGLFHKHYSDQIQVDYSMSVKDVFTIATQHIIRSSSELRIFGSVESPKHLENEAFPSWVPDWRANPESCRDVSANRDPKTGYLATRGALYHYNPSPHAYDLHVFGIQVGTVNQAGPFDDIHSVDAFNLPERYIHTNQPIYAALRQAQMLKAELGTFSPISAVDSRRRGYATFFDLATGWHKQKRKCTQCPTAHAMPTLTMEEALKDPEAKDVAHILKKCMESVDLHLFTTDSNHLGFGPKRTAAGDQIFLLIGSDVPFVLRPCGKKFELVGACYVHGIMYGEGLHQDMGLDSRLYPGSDPEGEWISAGFVYEFWGLGIEDISPTHRTLVNRNHKAKWEIMDASVDESGCVVQKLKLHEGEHEPLDIEAREIILQ